jgi:hypothetical protein
MISSVERKLVRRILLFTMGAGHGYTVFDGCDARGHGTLGNVELSVYWTDNSERLSASFDSFGDGTQAGDELGDGSGFGVDYAAGDGDGDGY